MALAAAVRFGTIGVQSFSVDELFTVWLVKMPLGHMLSTIPRTEATPPLFYLLEWGAARIFGISEATMRLLPALAGTLTVAAVYATARWCGSRRWGLAAALFAAVNPFLVWYSQEARSYALLVLLAAVGLMFLARYQQTGQRGALLGWAATAALGIATHYFAVFLVLPEAAWLIVAARLSWSQRAAAISLPLLTGLALLPLALHQREAVGDPGGVANRPLVNRLAEVPKNFLIGYSIPAEAVIGVLAGAMAAVGVVWALRQRSDPLRLAAFTFGALGVAGVAIPLLIAPLGFDYLTSRNVIPALVPGALFLGYGFCRGRAGVAALGVFTALSLATLIGIASTVAYQRPDWRGVVRALRPAVTERVLVFNPPFRYAGIYHEYLGPRTSLVPPTGADVREVDVVALIQPKPFGPHRPTPPTRPAQPPPPGFRLSADVLTSSYRIVRYSAARAVHLSIAMLAALTFPDVPAMLVSQPPAATERFSSTASTAPPPRPTGR